MTFSNVIQFVGCCRSKSFHYVVNSKPGIESWKDAQPTFICTTTGKEIHNSAHVKPVESDYDQLYLRQWCAAGSNNNNLELSWRQRSANGNVATIVLHKKIVKVQWYA